MIKEMVILHGRSFRLLFTPEQIKDRVASMGSAIHTDYAEKKPVFLTILNGGFVFAADLIRAFDGECEVAFVRLASYEGLASTGNIQTLLGVGMDLKDREVIVVEDIIDTGNTLSHFLSTLKDQRPASIRIAAFLTKPDAIQFPVEIAYEGFAIPPDFVVGYGLDYDGLGRNLEGIYKLDVKELVF